MGTTLTVTFDQARPKKFARHTGMRSGSIAWDHYLTNGCTLDFSTYFRNVHQVVFSDFSAGYAFEYDYTNVKAKVYTATTAGHIHAIALANAGVTANNANVALGNGTFTGNASTIGLGNTKLTVYGNMANTTLLNAVGYGNARLESAAATTANAVASVLDVSNSYTPGGVLGGNANIHTHGMTIAGNTDNSSGAAALSEASNSTDFSSTLTAVKFVVYGAM